MWGGLKWEEGALELKVTAVDGDEPPTPLVYELVGGPRGMTESAGRLEVDAWGGSGAIGRIP